MEYIRRKQLYCTFRSEVERIFESNLCFAFIFGSVSKGCEKATSDIDMFVCVDGEPSMQQRVDFLSLYMELHRAYGMVPDWEYPGELLSLESLLDNLDYIQNWTPYPKIETYREFEAVFFSAVLSETKAAVVQRNISLLDLEERCKVLARKWKMEVANGSVNCDIEALSLLEVLTCAGCVFLEQHRPS